MRKDYFENLHEAVMNNNEKARKYRDGKAWDNKKKKTAKSHMPRGKCYQRFCKMEWRRTASKLKDSLNKAEKLLEEVIRDR